MKFLVQCQSGLAILLLVVLAGCNQNESPQDLKEKTAKATEQAKRNAKAVVEGVREGWKRDQAVNLNTATKDQLLSLPGLTSAEADRVIAGRPYNEPEELATRHILPRTEYDKIADRLTAGK